MNWINYIISPAAGAIIGYFTNWLAIKMLFLPHTEKYLFNKKLPLTPGLIPKERLKLSHKIGEVAGDYILTDDTLTKYINTEQNKEKIHNIISQKIEELKNSEIDIEQLIEYFLKDKKDNILEQIDLTILKKIDESLENKEVYNNIIDFIVNKFMIFIQDSNEILSKQKIFDFTENVFVSKFTDFVFSTKLKNIIADKINSSKINNYISYKNADRLKALIEEKLPIYAEKLKELIEKDSDIDKKLRKFTKNIIDENMGVFTSLFVNSDKVYESIKKGIINYVSSEENQKEITEKILNYINNFMESDTKTVIEKIPDKIKESIEEKLTEKNIKDIIYKFTNYIKDEIDKKDFNLYSIIMSVEPDIENKTKKYIKNIYLKTFKEELFKYININYSKIKKCFMKVKVNSILKNISNENIDKINKFIFNSIDSISKNATDYVVKNLNISKIIEEKVNSFEVEVIEEIITSVAKKELNAITYVGGVLGFIIGFIPLILQNFF